MHFFFIALIIALFPQAVFAEGETPAPVCMIAGGPSEDLATYFTEVNRALRLVEAASRAGAGCGPAGVENTANGVASAEKLYQSTTRAINRAFTPWDFVASSDFFASSVARGGVPPAVKRDHDALVALQKRINGVFESAARRCSLDASLDLSSLWADSLLARNKTTVDGFMSDLLTAHTRLIDRFRASVGAIDAPVTYQDLYKLEAFSSSRRNEFWDGIANVYGSGQVLSACITADVTSRSGWAAIQESFATSFNVKRGITAWQESVKLMSNFTNREKSDPGYKAYKKREEELLARELRRQGVSAGQSQRILSSLGSDNPWDIGILQTFKNIYAAGVQLAQDFQSAVVEPSRNLVTAIGPGESITIAQLDRISVDTQLLGGIQSALVEDYALMLTQLNQTTADNSSAVDALIQMHIGLQGSSKILKEAIPDAENACTTTLQNVRWNCSARGS